MLNSFWTISFLLIHSQEIICTENGLEMELAASPSWADSEPIFNLDVGPSSHITGPANDVDLHLMTQLPSWAELERSLNFVDTPQPTTHVEPSDLTSNDTDLAAREKQRTQIQVLLDQHPHTGLDSILSSHEHLINADSNLFGAFFATSTSHNDPKNQFMNGPRLDRPTILPTQCNTDHAALPIHDLPNPFHQMVTHQQNKLKYKFDNSLDHLMRTSPMGLKIPELGKKYKHETERAFADDNNNSEKEVKQTSKRKRIQLNQSIPATYQKHSPGISSQKKPHFYYRWVNFKPSTIDGKLVIEVLANFRLKDGTNFFNFAANRGKGLGETIEGQFPHPQKTFCLAFASTKCIKELFKTFRIATFPPLLESDGNAIYQLVAKIRSRFTQAFSVNYKYSPHQIKIWEYKDHVLSDFEESFKECDKARDENIRYEIDAQRSYYFNKMKDLFPVYLLYVDLISALIPVQALDMECKYLQEQRKIAGDYYFKLIQEAFWDNKKIDLKNDGNDYTQIVMNRFKEMLQATTHSSPDYVFALIWKAIEYWISTSRKDLQDLSKLKRGNFKQFFNKLVFYWIVQIDNVENMISK